MEAKAPFLLNGKEEDDEEVSATISSTYMSIERQRYCQAQESGITLSKNTSQGSHTLNAKYLRLSGVARMRTVCAAAVLPSVSQSCQVVLVLGAYDSKHKPEGRFLGKAHAFQGHILRQAAFHC